MDDLDSMTQVKIIGGYRKRVVVPGSNSGMNSTLKANHAYKTSMTNPVTRNASNLDTRSENAVTPKSKMA